MSVPKKIKIQFNDGTEGEWMHTKDFIELFLNNSPGDNQFEEWWKLYNKKRSKAKAKKIFKRKVNTKNVGQLMEHTKLYTTIDAYGKNREFRKDPSTYLNQICWEDEIIKHINTKEEVVAEKLKKEEIYIAKMGEKTKKISKGSYSAIPDLVSLWKKEKGKIRNGK